MRYAFATPEWFACLHGILVERAMRVGAQHPDLRFSMCEVFTDVPRELSANGKLAWHVIVKGADVTFGRSERDDVDLKYTANFAAVAPLARFDTGDSPERGAELAKIVEGLMARGELKMSGKRSTGADALGSFHDAIARVTQ